MRSMKFLPGLFLLLFAFHSFAAGQSDASPAQFSSEQSPALTLKVAAREVVVDVQVLDKKGQPLTGLTADDFKVIEEREPQSIRSFEEHRPKPSLETEGTVIEATLPLNTFTNYTPPRNSSPPIVILLDAMDTLLDQQMERRSALVEYLKQMQPGPPVAIFQFDRTMRLIQGFTTDPKVLLAAAESLRDSPTESIPPSVAAEQVAHEFANEETLFRLKRQALKDGMSMLTRYLAGYPGRKHMIWFTGQLPMRKPNSSYPSDDHQSTVSGPRSSEAAELTDVLTISRVTVSVVDSSGLENPEFVQGPGSALLRASHSERRLANHANMDILAEQTGGKAYYDSNDLMQAITDVLRAGSNYYTLVYSTTNTKWNGEYRSIKVLVDRPNMILRHKQGYYALNLDPVAQAKASSDEKRREEAAAQESANEARAAASQLAKATEATSGAAPNASPAAPIPPKTSFQTAMELDAIPCTELLFVTHIAPDANQSKPLKDAPLPADNFMKPEWQHKPFRTYTIILKADASNIVLEKTPDGLRHGKIELAAVLYTQENEQVNSIFRSVTFVVNPDQYRRLLATGLLTKMQFAIPVKGNFFLRLGIHDVNGDKIGAFEIPVDQIKPEAAASNKP